MDNFPIHSIPSTLSPEIPDHQQQWMPTRDGIGRRKYATSVDERNYLSVYEYLVNEQWIIWDYHTGYVHLTGLWKALGNGKADIVKLVDSSPELEHVIKRVRGGYLKIQGTWVPFGVARTLAQRTCYHIRYCLVPLFGAAFPAECLTPDMPGFGQLQLVTPAPTAGHVRRRKRKSCGSVSGNVSGITSQLGQLHVSHPSQPNLRILNGAGPNVGPSAGPNANHTKGHKRRKSEVNVRPSHSAMVHKRTGSYPSIPSHAYNFSGSFDDDNPIVPTTPPPIPSRLDLSRFHPDIINSPSDMTDILQAGRSLQRLSMGDKGRRWSENVLGGGFEYAGKLWKWDGKSNIRVTNAFNSNESNDNSNENPNDNYNSRPPKNEQFDYTPVEYSPQNVSELGIHSIPSFSSISNMQYTSYPNPSISYHSESFSNSSVIPTNDAPPDFKRYYTLLPNNSLALAPRNMEQLDLESPTKSFVKQNENNEENGMKRRMDIHELLS